ncbi:MAG: Cell division and transport-associated protein TolR [Bacteriovoracaceae bacterium]|nr:Cell division and transport-associated protein TolR [Bacteriovoracaceae bacterium]
MAFNAKNSDNGDLNAEINIIPMVDIMLVLLIIFMVAAPLMNNAVDIKLPKAKTKEADVQEKNVTIDIQKDNTIMIGKTKVTFDELPKKLDSVFANREKKEVIIRADERVLHGFIIKVMAAIQNAGIFRISFLTDPTK